MVNKGNIIDYKACSLYIRGFLKGSGMENPKVCVEDIISGMMADLSLAKDDAEYAYTVLTGKVSTDELAKNLNGREYLSEITREEAQCAGRSGLIVIYGYSDDNMELRGACDDEIGAWLGCSVMLEKDSEGVISIRKLKRGEQDEYESFNCIHADWCSKEIENEDGIPECVSWSFRTKIPHKNFLIYEGGEPFCEGMIIKAEDIQ